jgi:hypothetical protein
MVKRAWTTKCGRKTMYGFAVCEYDDDDDDDDLETIYA